MDGWMLVQPLFSAVGVKDFITYGTFNELAERVVNSSGDVRKMVASFVSEGRVTSEAAAAPATSDRKRILLIDEVDVFFKEDFYGKMCVIPHLR